MKKLFIISLLFLYWHNILLAQNPNANIVPNGSFEEGQTIYNIPMCEYQPLGNNIGIDEGIANWRIAFHNNCVDEINTPDWYGISCNKAINDMTLNLNPYLFTITESCCSFDMHNDFNVIPSYRFMFLDSYFHYYKIGESSAESLCKKRNKSYEAIRVSLKEKLEANETYVLKLKYKAMQREYICADNNEVIYTGINTLRIHFSKWGPHWYSYNSNNQLWENAAVIWKNANNGNVDCNWHQVVYEINVPADYTDLGEMILYCAEGSFFIDEVELYKKCPEIIYVENKEFNIFNQPNSLHANDILIAGNNVDPTSTNGDVVVNSNANLTFIATNEVRLKHGFSTNGGEFRAYNAACTNETRQIVNNLRELENTESQVSIYPNPNNGTFTIEFTSLEEIPVDIIISNQLGQVVCETQIQASKQISIPSMESGIYFISCIFVDRIDTQKIIVE